jgi:FkbM family methyltransferase
MLVKDIILKTNTIVSNRLKYVVDLLNLENIEDICDIGSWHLGQSIEFLDLFPDANVYAFEANPDNYEKCVNIKSKLHGFYRKNLKIYNYALNDTCEKINFYPVINNNPGASSKYKFIDGLNGSFFGEEWVQDEIKVNAITLDQWRIENNVKKIDIIWIDVQGAELDVFKGSYDTLKNVQCIFTEVGLKPYYQGQSLKKDIDEFLIDEFGFIELDQSFEYNGSQYEANTIYIKKDLIC